MFELCFDTIYLYLFEKLIQINTIGEAGDMTKITNPKLKWASECWVKPCSDCAELSHYVVYSYLGICFLCGLLNVG